MSEATIFKTTSSKEANTGATGLNRIKYFTCVSCLNGKCVGFIHDASFQTISISLDFLRIAASNSGHREWRVWQRSSIVSQINFMVSFISWNVTKKLDNSKISLDFLTYIRLLRSSSTSERNKISDTLCFHGFFFEIFDFPRFRFTAAGANSARAF